MPDSSVPLRTRATLLRDRLLHRFGKGGTALLAILALLLVSSIAFAITAEKPWGRTVQKRLAKKEPMQPKEYQVIGLWWASIINTGLLTVLLGTAGRWMPRQPAPGSSAPPALPLKLDGSSSHLPPLLSRRWTFALVMGAVVFGTWERWPKLTQSFWNDEEYAIRRFAHGAWERQKDDTVKFIPVTWTDTLFENRNGNNHLLNSVTTRLSLDAWRWATGSPREAFNEFVTRIPQLLAGLASIVVMYLLGRECGAPLAGIGAAWLLAIHPWHIRYSVEMRGYALMLFFVSLTLYGLVRALRTNELRWWLLFGLCEALFLLSFPGAMYVAFTLNIVCVIELLRQRRWDLTGRLMAFNTIGAVPVVMWMMPSVPQILIFLKEEQPAYVTDVIGWLRDLGSVLSFGWPYLNTWPEAHIGTDWVHTAKHFPVSSSVLAIIFGSLLLTGIIVAFARGTAARIIIVGPVLAAVVSMVMNLRPGAPMTVWYLIYLLIPTTLAVYLAVEQLGRVRNLRWLPAAFVVWFTVRYSMGASSAIAAVREHDRQPLRQTIQFMDQQAPNAVTATFGVSDRQCSTYDPDVTILETAQDLDDCIARAKAANRPLYIYYCSDEHGKKRRLDVYNRVVKSDAFERLTEFPGSEELFSYRVFRLKPTS